MDEFVVGELELGEELVAVGFVEGAPGVAAVDAIFVVVVESVALAGWTVFGEAVGGAELVLVHDDEFGISGVLLGFAEVAPESGFGDEVATAVEVVAAGFVGDLGFADVLGGATHVWRAA